jgi:hypothetical protein
MLQYLDTIIAFAVIMLGVSLLITTLNQMISALLGYRGTNLLWGIQTLLSTIEPGLSTKAKGVATDILKKPFISDSIFSKFVKDVPVLSWFTNRWKLASAMTPQELVRSLTNLAQTMPTTSDGKATADWINKVLAQVDPEANRKAEMLKEVFKQLGPNVAIQADRIVQQLGTSVQESVGKLEAWFDTVMKRTSQRFTSQMRIWTIVFAVLFAFGAHLDTFAILKQLWTTPELRASLVNDRETILKEASVVLSVQSGTAQVAGPGVPPQILGRAMKALKEIEKEATAGLGDAPKEFANLNEAENWLRKNVKVESLKEKLVEKYRDFVLAELSAQRDKIEQALAKAGFEIQFSWAELKELFKGQSKQSILGILITAGLLSLGAPFWFNILRSLSNLRPLLAKTSTKTTTGSTQS